jgi:2-iminobutanoate/2-iminopropanoate deaminase
VPISAHNADNAPRPSGDYAQVTQAFGISRVVWVSGQIPVDATGNLPAAFADQARNAWRNLIAQLDNVNLSIDNLAKVTIYLADRKYAMENRAIRKEILGDRKVAMTVVIAGIFDEAWLLEIEGTAAE